MYIHLFYLWVTIPMLTHPKCRSMSSLFASHNELPHTTTEFEQTIAKNDDEEYYKNTIIIIDDYIKIEHNPIKDECNITIETIQLYLYTWQLLQKIKNPNISILTKLQIIESELNSSNTPDEPKLWNGLNW